MHDLSAAALDDGDDAWGSAAPAWVIATGVCYLVATGTIGPGPLRIPTCTPRGHRSGAAVRLVIRHQARR